VICAAWALCQIPVSRAAPADDQPVVDARTVGIIEKASRWLVKQQSSNGSWKLDDREGHPVAMTGYAMLALMGAGNLPDEGPHGEAVRLGMEYLLGQIQPDGLFRDAIGGKYMYNHGIATIALCEIYGQSGVSSLKPKVERLVKTILEAQDDAGGWRYQPSPRGADISVTVLQAVALRSAVNAGLAVPAETIKKALDYVRTCSVPNTGGFSYQAGGGSPGFARTAAAIYTLQVMGVYDDPLIDPGLRYLTNDAKDTGWFTYGHYYAAPAFYIKGENIWKQWYGAIHDKLVDGVTEAGDEAYWDPKFDNGNQGQGRVYVTAVYIHILAMPFHYIPLYQR
jgi:hypothetical protein